MRKCAHVSDRLGLHKYLGVMRSIVAPCARSRMRLIVGPCIRSQMRLIVVPCTRSRMCSIVALLRLIALAGTLGSFAVFHPQTVFFC